MRRLTVVCLLVVVAVIARAQETNAPQLTAEEQKLAEEAKKLNEEGVVLYRQGKPADGIPKVRQALLIRERLYPESKHPNGHIDLATSINDLGFGLIEAGAPEKARMYYERALTMYRKLYPSSKFPNGHAALATSLNNMGYVLQVTGAAEAALPYYQQSLAMTQLLYPASDYPIGHAQIAEGLNNLGFVLSAMGQFERALEFYQQAFAMQKKIYPPSLFPNGHTTLVRSLSNIGTCLARAGAVDQSLPYLEEALAIRRKLYPESQYPDGHPELALSLNNLGILLNRLGAPEKALPYYEQALAMRRKLYSNSKYPSGHPELATSLSDLGIALLKAGAHDKSLPYCEEALAMRKRIYPPSDFPAGHREIASSLNDLGFLYDAMESPEKALIYHENALAMRRGLYSQSKSAIGNTELADSLTNVGATLVTLARPDKAIPYFEEALAQFKERFPGSRYPLGHPELATGLENLGGVLMAASLADLALSHVEQALAIRRSFAARVLSSASETDALAYLNKQPRTRDVFLSLTQGFAAKTSSAYRLLWDGKSSIMRLLRQRHAAAGVAGSKHAAKLDDLKGKRRRIEQLLHGARMAPDERDKLLTKLTDERDAIERELARDIPLLKSAAEIEELGPDSLLSCMPDGVVLIDFVRYARIEYADKKQQQTLSYAAFLLAKDRAVVRIELKEAAPIDAAIRQWREAIESRRDAPAATTELVQRVWDKLAPHIPTGTRTLYLAPDGDLARLPWAAMPITKDRVLLEDYAIAQVPHGPFLLEQLKYPRSFTGPEKLLTVSDVNYNSPNWPALPGTGVEAKAIAALSPGKCDAAGGKDATRERIIAALPQARFAHIATHGHFNADELTKEKKRAELHMKTRPFGDETRAVAYKNPLGFVGLVLANGEVLSGLSILDLPLENMKLVTLSACETGLGELTGGEGVQGLQRAFHLAGCENVVCSLWNVNDDATAALMKRFYYHLWEKKESPIQALRLAQLELYRNPTQVADLLRGGAPKFSGSTKPLPKEEAPKGGERAATKLWAAFVLSGVGR